MQQALSQRVSFYLIAASVVTTLFFHLTLAEHIRGFAVSAFFVLLVTVTHGLFAFAKIKPNRWSYWFLLPVLFSIIATALYASSQAQIIGLIVATLSFTLFAYWSTAPVPRFDMVHHFLPYDFFRETLLPFGFSSTVFQPMSHGAKWKSIFIGALISLPILFVFISLFASADQLFSKTISDAFTFFDVVEFVVKVFWDVILFVMILCGGWIAWSRVTENRVPRWNIQDIRVDHAIVNTVLVLMNILFLVFVGFQFVYFFAGHDYIQGRELVYSEYMRQGFDQLLFAAGLVLGGTFILHRLTQFTSRVTAFLCGSLIVQTLVILGSATKRLWLYVDAYHLSIQRYWGFVILFFVLLMLLGYLVTLLRQICFSNQLKLTMIFTLSFFSAVLLVNQNQVIAQWNLAQRGEVVMPDLYYIVRLLPDSASAIQESVKAHPDLWQTTVNGIECKETVCFSYTNKQLFVQEITDKDVEVNRELLWPFWTISDVKARLLVK